MGQSIVPFEPKEELLGVAFETPPTEARWPSLLQQMERMGLVPYPDGTSYLAVGGSIAFFRAAKPGRKIFGTEDEGAADLLERVVLLFGRGNARVGMPIDLRPGRVKVLDNSYTIRFGSKRASKDVKDLACTQQAIAYPLPSSPNTWVFEFDERNDYRKHLSSLEELRKRDPDVLYAEPNLMFELQKHACTELPPAPGESCPDIGVTHSCSPVVAANATNDPWSKCQTNLVLQGVPDAWCFLEQTLGAANKRGSADVCIATVDFGINQTHPDVTTGLLNYVPLCYSCPDPDDAHGMAVYGIVSAKPDNETGTSGIAPGAQHLAIRMKAQWRDPPWYSQMILWLAGVESSETFSEPPLARPADIISCSHGMPYLPTANLIADAFRRVTQDGRKRAEGGALGTVLVYSTGNDTCDIAGTEALASDPHVIAVGNTLPPDASGVEKREPSSNYGDRVDLCAQGQYAPSLLANPNLESNINCAPSGRAPGAFQFVGTSAACPMVAATVALMLSVNKNLAWADVRGLLRQTARCVDPDGGNWQGGRSYFYGSGRLDVHAAVRAAAGASA
jgi:subtilisin family serine protease